MSFLFAFHVSEYKVRCHKEIKKKITIKKPNQKVNGKKKDENQIEDGVEMQPLKDLTIFKKREVSMKKLLIKVDHKKLLTEFNIPVGFLR